MEKIRNMPIGWRTFKGSYMQTEHAKLRYIEVTATDLPLYCPMPNTSLWNAHPRVAIPVDKAGEARCPYCGTLYKFKGELPKGHH